MLQGALPDRQSGLDVTEPAQPLLAAGVRPDLAPAGAAGLSPGARRLVQHPDPFADRGQEGFPLLQTVGVAEEAKTIRLPAGRKTEPLARLLVVERNEPVGGPSEVPKRRARRSEVPVDERAGRADGLS